MNFFAAVILFISGCSMVNAVVQIKIAFSGPEHNFDRAEIFEESEYQFSTSDDHNTSLYSIPSSEFYKKFHGFQFDDKLTPVCTITRKEKDKFGVPLNFKLKKNVKQISLPTNSANDVKCEVLKKTGIFQGTSPDENVYFQIEKLIPLILIPITNQILSDKPSIAVSPIRLEEWEYEGHWGSPGKTAYWIDRKTFSSRANILPDDSNLYSFYKGKQEINNQTFDLFEEKIQFASEDVEPEELDSNPSSDNVTSGTTKRHFVVMELDKASVSAEEDYLGLSVKHLSEDQIVNINFPARSYLVVDESDITEGNASYAIPWTSIETEYNYKFRPTGEVNYHKLLESFAGTGKAIRAVTTGRETNTTEIQNVTATPNCYIIESAKDSTPRKPINKFHINKTPCALYQFHEGDTLPESCHRVVYIKATKP